MDATPQDAGEAVDRFTAALKKLKHEPPTSTAELIKAIEVGLETGRLQCADEDLHDKVALIRTGMAALLTYRVQMETENTRLRGFVARVVAATKDDNPIFSKVGADATLFHLRAQAREIATLLSKDTTE